MFTSCNQTSASATAYKHHHVYAYKRPKVFAYVHFDIDALISLASKLRGKSCTVDMSMRPKAGSTHWVIFIIFEDGVEWVFRSPRSGLSAIIADESASKLLTSEASTLKYLRNLGSMPVPEVFSFRRVSKQRPVLHMTDHDREKIMEQLGTIMSQLLDIHFDKIGSLFQDSNGNYFVGECLSPSLLWQHRDELEGIDRGPFDRESQYLRSLISAFTAHAEELPLRPHSFFAPIPDPFKYPNWTSYRKAVERWQTFCSIGGKVEGNKNRLDFCIAGQFLSEMVPYLASPEENFVLCHPDLHLGNIFVDDDFNITCIIDWSSAAASPTAELLSTPGLNGSLSPPKPSFIAAFRSRFCNGSQTLGPQLWERADKMWYFLRLVQMLSTQDDTLFKSLYDLVYNRNSDDIPRLFHERSMPESGQAIFAKLCEGEPEEEEDKATQKDNDNDQTNVSVEVVVARKLTLMSEMNTNFVAGKRLWLWMRTPWKHWMYNLLPYRYTSCC
ncbi:RNase H domain containing [Fusarium acutatum]|uniref:RNase H domain containing n=1 Tax=Fusarium acutatum TaxID=78861 RepID=A0A8H4JQT5_9HYPO|nr:RNase H domain containing [Fusarium acutatum]